MKIEYPIAVDNDRKIWNAFSNQYWPALYVIDAKGRIIHHQFGEGGYEESETIFQQLLSGTGHEGIGHDLVSVEANGAEVAADWGNLKSPENYLGYGRTENFSSPGGAVPGKHRIYTVPGRLTLNQWGLSGDWTMAKQSITLNKSNGRITCRFHARDLNLVMGPRVPDTPVRFRVFVDGKTPDTAKGTDLDSQGNGTITEQRLYQLIRQTQPITDRLFEIEFLDPGAEAFSFTFG